ncbi:MAG TPA: fused MFS/spermidine synthase [Vicinamibacterales bacterium]|nr:fused MFS/spermidine synthase [Vicinamibacterales bacterium]
MRSKTWTTASLLFGSGFCALVYQIGWLREFRLIFGASTAASAAVLAIFVGGLGIGSLLLGPRADAQARPLRFYSNLEATIAVCAAASPLLLALVRAAYIASGGSATLGTTVATLGRLVLSAIVLAVPTIAMGGTLPAAARAVTRTGDARRQDVATLYAVNTLGAVVGCMAATFWMLEIFGTRQTLWLAAAINLLVAMIARQIDRTWAEAAGPAGEATPPTRPTLPTLPTLPTPPAFVIAASGTVGFAFFLLELIWYRMLAPLLGGSVFTFGLVLAVALVGIGVGGLLYSLVVSSRPATLTGFATSCLLEAVAVAFTYAMGDRLATLALVLVPLRAGGFAATIGGWTLVTAIVVLPPALVAGYQFPLLIALLGQGRDHVGNDVGLAYAANTTGAIVGSLAGGFGLLPWLTAPVAWKLVAAVLALLGLAALVQSLSRASRAASIGLSALAATTVVLLFAAGPTAFWRHSGIGAGRTPVGVTTAPNSLAAWMRLMRRAVVWQADGVESTVALSREASGFAFIVNGKSDGSAVTDAGTQVMLGLLGALRQPAARRALVIGLGTGSSAGWLAAVPTMERVDVVELEPVVVDVARACTPVNHDALANPKLHVTIGDARETLLTGRGRYDVIASEPSNPFRAGIASLFTEEYYRAARARLSDDGVFAQWVQAYEVDAPTIRTIYATLGAVFPYIETWQTHRGDLVLLGMSHRLPFSASATTARIAEEPFRSAIVHAWRAADLNGVLAHFIANDEFARAMARGGAAPHNTDDRNIVEFGLARSVGRSDELLSAAIRRAARTSNTWRPPLDTDAGVSWTAVDTAWTYVTGAEAEADASIAASNAERSRRIAIARYYGGDMAGALAMWQTQTDPPRDPAELAMAADLAALTGSDAAVPLAERLRSYDATEADIVLAELRVGQKQPADALPLLESAFVRMRTDPWALPSLKQKALDLAEVVARTSADANRRMYDALARRFAVDAVNDSRLLSLVEIAAEGNFAAMCRGPIELLEPAVVWSDALLRRRRDCYEATHDPRLPQATRDLETYLAQEPQPIVVR